MNSDKIKQIQAILGVEADGILGPQTRAAFDALSVPDSPRSVIGSSFADPADVRAFRKCKAEGKSDEECFKIGDNAIGYWGDDTSEGSGPSCALPPEHIIEKWGTVNGGKHKPVKVAGNGKEVVCLLKDTMPHLANITTLARIDLNPDAVRLLGWTPPIMNPVSWEWA